MQKKHRELEHHRRLYLKAYKDLTQNGSTSPPAVKEQLRSRLAGQEGGLTQFLGAYNRSVDNYILCLSDLTNKFTEGEKERKRSLKAAVQKYMIYEMSAIKNLEYSIDRYCKAMEQMGEGVAINDKAVDADEEQGTVALAKVSANNYMEYLKSDALESGKHKIPTVKTLRETYKDRLDQARYNSALREAYGLLDHLQQTKDILSLKKVVEFGQTVHKTLPDNDGTITSISLSEGMYCHDVFKDRAFWEAYTLGVLAMLERETGSMSGLQYDTQEELEDEMRFVRTVRLDGAIKADFFRRVEEHISKHVGVFPRNVAPPQTQATL